MEQSQRLEPPGMMLNPNSFISSRPLPENLVSVTNPMEMSQNLRIPFNPFSIPASRPVDSPIPPYQGDDSLGMRSITVISGSETSKKKRGRPRKYGPEGNITLNLTPPFARSECSNSLSLDPSAKKRGRPLGSGKRQQLDALASTGTNFTPHVIIVKAGEDVASKIMAFSQQGSRAVCVLSANGIISTVMLRQTATYGGTVTYEGRYEIISLSGSYLFAESDGTHGKTGSLSIVLAGSDGRVIGGGVAGMLQAASPIQVVLSSFNAEGKKPKHKPEHSSQMQHGSAFSGIAAASPPSQGTASDKSTDGGGDDGDGGSPVDEHGDETRNNSANPDQHVSLYRVSLRI